MSPSSTEYRVRWRREGRGPTSKIFQTWDAAYRKAQGILGLEAVKERTNFYAMPDLEFGPVIESRPVGAWAPTVGQAESSEAVQEAMLDWAGERPPERSTVTNGYAGEAVDDIPF